MYRALIVDDEAHAVRGLVAGVRWDRLDIVDVRTAHSLRQAVDIFETETIDLMVCDIEMPQGSGLELLEWVREHRPQTETIFLTCHSEFYYTKRAIQLSSFDYLLKPVDYEDMENVIVKALGKIKDSKDRQISEEMLKGVVRKFESHRPLRIERFWRELVEQTVPSIPAKINELSAELNVPYTETMKFCPIFIRVRKWHKQLSQREQRIMTYALRNAAEEKVAGMSSEGGVLPVDFGALLVLLPDPTRDQLLALKNVCQEYIESCNRYFNCNLCVYIGDLSYTHEVVGSLAQLRKADTDNVTISNEVLVLRDVPKEVQTLPPLPLKEWGEWLMNGSKDRLTADFQRYMSDLRANKLQLDAASLRLIYQDFLQMLFYVLQYKGLQAKDVFAEKMLTDKPEEVLDSVESFTEWALYFIEVAISRLHSAHRSLTVVECVKQFVAEKLGEQDLSREDIASYVYLNPDYLSRLFKKETKMSISDYLQLQRIEYAKGLLERSEQSVSDIAVAAGYSNLSYFSTIFKKETGCSPSDYRKLYKTC
ncbi:two-component system response regulator YesN [Paenibacillus taihuensis]|uniref:Two-component system response regulator YesN n=1 Tax=Paenibacillus taihuensis TaxID=1156355 RepID=A0A3D9SQ25_9BACL|nr:helix-turn-helix domain-containing protein [Paenibacillus taihuensis]REE92771.1 two-component system response regulator YesN [Paenibacillus taihuensis]